MLFGFLSGAYPERLPPGASVKLYNMVATPPLLNWLDKQKACSIEVVLSQSLHNDLGGDEWFRWGDLHGANVRSIGGTGLYVPGWLP